MKRFLLTILLLIGFEKAHALTLTTSEVVRRTRDLSLSGKILILNNKLADADVIIAKSQYDPVAAANLSYTKDNTERSSTIFGTSTSQTQFSAGLSQLTPLGTQLQFGFTNTRDSTNSAFFNPNTYYDSRLTSQITQPLLKNSLGLITRQNIKLYKTARTATQSGTEAKLRELTAKNLMLYWRWYLTRHLANIHEQAVVLANRLYSTNTQKLKMGLIETPDLHAFAANLNIKSSNLIALKTEVSKTENQLRTALNIASSSPLTPGTENSNTAKPAPIDQLITRALNTHPALLASREDLKAHNIRLTMQKNAKLPQLDLVASLASNGLDAGYTSAAGDIADFNPVWSTGVNFSFPLGNRAARHEFKKLDIVKQQKLYTLKDLENQIISQITAAYDHYQNAGKNLGATSDAVYNQKMKWDGEVRRYHQGRSDPDLVIRYQDDYLNAKAAHLQAKVELGLAWIDLEQAQGKALKP